jgi:uncharacterized protein YgiM (DUF1202 family)
VARKKKQGSNLVGLVILGAIGFGIYQFGIVGNPDRSPAPTARPVAVASAPAKPATKPATTVPLNAPRFVNVASLNVRHTPSTTGPLIMTMPQGTQLKVLGREKGWLLIDINPTLEGWVSEQLTTTERPNQRPTPPAALRTSQ